MDTGDKNSTGTTQQKQGRREVDTGQTCSGKLWFAGVGAVYVN